MCFIIIILPSTCAPYYYIVNLEYNNTNYFKKLMEGGRRDFRKTGRKEIFKKRQKAPGSGGTGL